MAKSGKSGFDEVTGIVLIGAGILLFLALVSYDPADVPGWVFFSSVTPQNAKAGNFIGIAGVLVAGLLYFLFGAASYLISVLLFGFGTAKLLLERFALPSRLGWSVLFVLCGASLLHLQTYFLTGWKSAFKIEGPGGWFGYYLGGRAFPNVVGDVGSAIILIVLYLASLILVTGFHPIRFIKLTIAASRDWLEKRKQARLQRLSDREQFEARHKELEKQSERITKTMRKKGIANPEPTPEPEREKFPEPKIIDASVPPPPRKPTLEEVQARAKAKAKPEIQSGLSEVKIDDYTLPSLDLLDPAEDDDRAPADPRELKATQDIIIDTLAQFAITASPGDITKGPTITRYELYPAKGVRVDRISALERDIARATCAERINIIAPIPGKDTVGIEIANSNKVKVTLRELFETDAWTNSKARLPLALGKDVYGTAIIADLAQMPHCLVAGTTGSGKSVCINAIIASLVFKFTPEQLRFIMIDPKVVEMQIYNALPHLVTPVVTDPKKVLLALRWVIDEMETRYRVFAKCGVRNVAGFNSRPKPKTQAELDAEAAAKGEEPVAATDPVGPEGLDTAEIKEEQLPKIRVPRDDDLIIPEQMPYIVVIVDELADLMQTAPADVESAIARITQMARAAGIHMIVATQTPRADVVTGIIKANIPSRIAFQVASKIDSRVILDENGAEKLLGQGDMLYLPPGTSKLLRSQGVLVTDEEIRKVVEYAAAQGVPQFEPSIHEKLSRESVPEDEVSDAEEELIEKCLEIIRQEQRASTSMLQRRLKLGYGRAARVVDILEQRGILGPKEGAKDREILIDLDSLP